MLLCLLLMGDVTQPKADLPKQEIETGIKDGYYKVTGPKYTGIAYIKRVPDKQAYLVHQYTSVVQSTGIGFVQDGKLVVGWTQGPVVGSTTVRFRNGVGDVSWISNPGSGIIGRETWTFLFSGDDE
jgi:expansin (peptidoglycan-binding protein)